MAERAKIRKQVVYDKDEQSEDLEDLHEENSFEDGNKIYVLKSQIHSLQIEKNKLSLEHQAALSSMEAKNQQLNQQINLLKRQNTKLITNLRKLQQENQQQKKLIDTYKNQIESVNRRTADFHRSIEDKHIMADPDFVVQMLNKDKKIEELTKKIQALELRPNQSMNGSLTHKISENQKQKYEQDIRNYKNSIDELKKKQIAYKREYEGMIQAKEQIIKKMSNQIDESSRKIVQSKDRVLMQLKKQYEDLQRKAESYKNQVSALNQKASQSDRELGKIRAQFKRKEQSLVNHYENQKEQLTKLMNQKLKKHIKDKQQKLNKNEEKSSQLENQILILKQQLSKQKTEVLTLNQYNSYLETSNKQYEEAKKKLQSSLYEKEREISELKQSSFAQIAQLKKLIIQQRAQNDQKISTLEQEILGKNMIVQKYEKELYQIERREEQGAKLQQANNNRQIEKLMRQKQDLSRDLDQLQQRYRQKSDKMNSMEKRIRKEYEERITGLETQLLSQREKAREQKKQVVQAPPVQLKDSNSEQLQKYKNISELRRLEIEEKQMQIKKLSEQKNRLEKQFNRFKQDSAGIQKRLKEKGQDYRNLEISFDDLSEKYRKGVKQLQSKIEEMQEQIVQERKRAERRKNDAAENEKNLLVQLKQYKSKVKEYQEQLAEYRNRKVEDAQHTDLKLQKLAHEISMINKQKQSAIKNQERKTKQKQDVLVDEKNKLLQYIEQLEENNDILNKKVAMLEGKQKKGNNLMQKQLRDLKIEYSESLKEVNLILQKYKKLEDVHRETIANIESIKEEKDVLNKKYVEIYKEKNKIFDELNSAYDQINKLNLVLMSKQEQLHRSKTVNCPHYESKPRIYTQVSETPVFSSKSKSPAQFYDRSQSYYSTSQSKFNRYG